MSALLHFYTIKNDFITKMKSLDSKIQNNYDGKRPYIGVLLVVNGLNYYAPLSSYKEKQDRIKNELDSLNSLSKEFGNLQKQMDYTKNKYGLKDYVNSRQKRSSKNNKNRKSRNRNKN